jgi:hypothetical protein
LRMSLARPLILITSLPRLTIEPSSTNAVHEHLHKSNTIPTSLKPATTACSESLQSIVDDASKFGLRTELLVMSPRPMSSLRKLSKAFLSSK